MAGNTQHPGINELRSLFTEREDLYAECTRRMVELAEPTLLAAMVELFATPRNNITVIELALVEDSLCVVVALNYNEGAPVPELVQAVSPIAQEMPNVYRLLRVGMPLDVVFEPKEDIVSFLRSKRSISDEMAPREEVKADDTVQTSPDKFPAFDPAGLTDEQLRALRLSLYATNTTKH